MTIRDLVEGDAAEWWRLRLEALEREPFAFGKSTEEHRATLVETIATRFREVAEGNCNLGAFEGERLAGMATLLRETGLKERHKARIYGVYVDSAFRGKGVGRALMEELLARARKSSSLDQILLAVASSQMAAKGLYKSLGFERYGTEPRALKVGEEYVDEEHMVLLL